jgi:poly-gamma-glutamate synthesis protein (capsule biosynthesis protein)
MKVVLRQLLRVLLLLVMTASAHLLLMWLWNPWTPVPGPATARASSTTGGSGPGVIIFGGDTAPTDAASPYLRRFGYEYPFSATVHLMREADLALVNLEAPVTTRTETFPLYKTYLYKVDPRALQAMVWAGIDAVSLANNHVMDYGQAGLNDTLRHLRAAEIVAVGAGEDGGSARRGVVWRIRGTRVGVLSYMEDSFMHSLYVRSFAWGSRPGVARLEAGDIEDDLRRMRGRADVVVVVVHWGRNYTGVTLLQRLYGRMMIDYGADAVVGHHPHIHHPVGVYRGRPILYSLGNYAFGTPGRSTFRYGMLARFRLEDRRLRRVELIPLVVQNRSIRFKPERATGVDANKMLTQLARDSASMGARITVRGGVGILEL